jgi:hypothetical protein
MRSIVGRIVVIRRLTVIQVTTGDDSVVTWSEIKTPLLISQNTFLKLKVKLRLLGLSQPCCREFELARLLG